MSQHRRRPPVSTRFPRWSWFLVGAAIVGLVAIAIMQWDRPWGSPPEEMVWIPRGEFWMGSDDGPFDERPMHQVKISGFWMDRHEVTNAQFARFVAETGYVTVAERQPN